MSTFRGAVTGLAIFLCVELILILFVLMAWGVFADAPMQFLVDVCTSSGTNIYDMGVFVFVGGTIFNVIIMAVIAVRSRY